MSESVWPWIWAATFSGWVVTNIGWQWIVAKWRALHAGQEKSTEAWRRIAIDLTRRHDPDAFSALAGLCARNGWEMPAGESEEPRQ